VTVRYRWENPAAAMLSLLTTGSPSTSYDFAATVRRVRE
jgi:uncharacterized protein with gpF-like domain